MMFKTTTRSLRSLCKLSEKLIFRYEGTVDSVWTQYIQLAADYKPLNLGQGFPDYSPPQYMMDVLSEVANKSDYMLHQYTRGFGHPRLVAAISKLFSKLIGRKINEHSEVVIATGAYEALNIAISGHTEVGDEVIIIEPFYNCYELLVKYAGGVPRYIPLRLKNPCTDRLPTSEDYALDKKELESMFNERTKMIIISNPNNPIGKVFTEEELTHIGDLCKKWNVLCLTDEVYEWMIYKPHKHIRMAGLPGMWERTITIGSVGKSLSVTGWKLGWAYAPANLMKNLHILHQNTLYASVTPTQEAAAIAIERETERFGDDDCYFFSLARSLEKKRDYMKNILVGVGMRPIIPDGGSFMLVDWSPLESKVDMNSEPDQYKDYRFTKWMSKNVGVQGIPPTVFYSKPHKHLVENCVRYCFLKKEETLKKVQEAFNRWKTSGK